MKYSDLSRFRPMTMLSVGIYMSSLEPQTLAQQGDPDVCISLAFIVTSVNVVKKKVSDSKRSIIRFSSSSSCDLKYRI